MRVSTLPSAGLISNGNRLRIEAAKAISAIEIVGGRSGAGGKHSSAKTMADFFTACGAAIASFVEAVAPTPASRNLVPSASKRITILFSEGLDRKFVPAPAAFVLTGQVQVPSSVTVEGPFVYLDFPVAFTNAAVNVAYTQPGAGSNLRDLSGNLVASFAAAAVTNSIP